MLDITCFVHSEENSLGQLVDENSQGLFYVLCNVREKSHEHMAFRSNESVQYKPISGEFVHTNESAIPDAGFNIYL